MVGRPSLKWKWMILITMLYVILVQVSLSCLRNFMICLICHLWNNTIWMFFCLIMLWEKPLGRVDDVHIMVNNNFVHYDFVVLDIECDASCPIVLGRPFLELLVLSLIWKKETLSTSFHLRKVWNTSLGRKWSHLTILLLEQITLLMLHLLETLDFCA